MNLFIKRTVSVMLCLVMVMAAFVAVVPESVIPASAATYRTGANGIQSSYASSRYYSQFQKIELTGDGRTDVLAIALSQLGYQESSSSSVLGGNGGGSGNYTEYNYNMGDFGVGYGGSSYAWCATFVSWALYQSRCTDQNTMSAWTRYHSGDSNYVWREVGCANWASQLRTCGYFQRSKAATGNTYQPQSGDLIFFSWTSATSSEDHIGIVVYSDDSYVYTIEGNTSNQNGLESDGGGVYFKKYSLGYSYITGYGVLPYKTDSSVTKIDYSGANPTPGYYVCNASKYVYATETSTDVAYYTQRFSMFEVVGVASNGRLKCQGITTSTGAVVEGYILNNEDRVIQLTASQATETAADKLDKVIAEARTARYDHYTPSALATLRSVFNEAVALRNTSASDTSLEAMTVKLRNALDNNIYDTEQVVSVGKTYSYTAANRGDSWDDDGKKMTDGAKGSADGGDTAKFSGWGGHTTVDIVVDLGGNVASDTFRIYTAYKKDWGINYPMNLEISVSNDNVNFTSVGSTAVRNLTCSGTDTETDWYMYTMTLKTKTVRTERYIKFTVTPNEDTNHVWLEEVEVASAGIASSGSIYVTGIDKYITAGDCVIFTPDAGEITTEKYNHSWTVNAIASWNAAQNAYIVKSVFAGSGSDTQSVTLASGEIMIAGHEWESGTDNPVYGSRSNVSLIKSLEAGDKLTFTNINLSSKTLSAAPAVAVTNVNTDPVTVPDNAKTFWVTHANDNSAEGAGVIITNSADNIVNGWAWRLIVVFKPVSGSSGVYEISEIYDHLSLSAEDANVIAAHANSSIPAGGFIYTLNYGNDYISLGQGDTDYTSANCNSAIADAKTWQVGDKLTFYGIDPADPVVSTSTPGELWYDDAYICTSYYVSDADTPVVPDDPSDPVIPDAPVTSTAKLGDIDNDGDIDQYDYILAKRIHFNNYSPSSGEKIRGDVDKDGDNDQYDYILIKRHHFNNYTIEGTVEY